MLKLCLDCGVLVGLAAVGVGIYAIAPGAAAALPILSLAACPVSMLFMIKAMRGTPGKDGRLRATADGVIRGEQLARMRAQQKSPSARIGAGAGRGVKNGTSGKTRFPTLAS